MMIIRDKHAEKIISFMEEELQYVRDLHNQILELKDEKLRCIEGRYHDLLYKNKELEEEIFGIKGKH